MLNKNINWIRSKLNRSCVYRIPKKSGIYVIYKDTELFNFVHNRKMIYVGKSTNLQTRIKSHISRPQNPVLQSENFSELYCAYALFPDEHLNYIESEIFDKCDLTANRIRPPKNKHTIEQITQYINH